MLDDRRAPTVVAITGSSEHAGPDQVPAASARSAGPTASVETLARIHTRRVDAGPAEDPRHAQRRVVEVVAVIEDRVVLVEVLAVIRDHGQDRAIESLAEPLDQPPELLVREPQLAFVRRRDPRSRRDRAVARRPVRGQAEAASRRSAASPGRPGASYGPWGS